MGKPIRPEDVAAHSQTFIPSEVFDAFNDAIAAKYADGISVVKQDEIVSAILARLPNVSRADIFARGWLNIESAYRAAGWTVEYDKPGYNETYRATFTFARKR